MSLPGLICCSSTVAHIHLSSPKGGLPSTSFSSRIENVMPNFYHRQMFGGSKAELLSSVSIKRTVSGGDLIAAYKEKEGKKLVGNL